MPPGRARPDLAIDNDPRPRGAPQILADRQPSLAGADDHDVPAIAVIQRRLFVWVDLLKCPVHVVQHPRVRTPSCSHAA